MRERHGDRRRRTETKRRMTDREDAEDDGDNDDEKTMKRQRKNKQKSTLLQRRYEGKSETTPKTERPYNENRKGRTSEQAMKPRRKDDGKRRRCKAKARTRGENNVTMTIA